MMFTNAYAANPLCSPTRASIMTGKYPARLGITTPAGHLPPQPDVPLLAKTARPWMKMVCPRSRRFLPLKEYTIAEAFKDAGYATGFIGKWHLGHEPWWPKKQGFEVNIAGEHHYVARVGSRGVEPHWSPETFPALDTLRGHTKATRHAVQQGTDKKLRRYRGSLESPRATVL